ncbi:hypothetical protein DRW03_02410 [Corallococcus sp. H22C18031201]|nr:hypothetical protein DRW03_02410 [Corallococcus sp. H22C18031201]
MALVMGLRRVRLPSRVSDSHVCEGADHAWAGVWDGPRKATLEAAFLATGRPFAQESWRHVRRTLDAYSHTWDVTWTAACEAARGRGEEALLAQREACLDGRLAQVDALLRRLAPGDVVRVEHAPFAVEALPSLAACMKPGALAAPDAVVLDAWALLVLGLPEEGLRHLARASGSGLGTEGAASLRDEPVASPVRAEGAAARSRDEGASGGASGVGATVDVVDPVGRALIRARLEAARSGPSAEALAVEAGRLAEASRDDASAARAWTLAMRLVGNPPEQASRAQQWRERASASLSRLGAEDELEGQLAVDVARLFAHQDRLGEAAQQIALALPRLERRFGAEGFEVAHARAELGAVRRAQGRYAEALGLYERALGTVRGALGPDHPEVARLRLEQAETRVRQRDLAQAERLSLGALAVLERALGPEHPRLEEALARVAAVLEQEGRAEEAKPYRERLARLRAHP